MSLFEGFEYDLLASYVSSYLGDLRAHSVSFADQRWQYLEGGEGPAILFLHALLGRKMQWRSMMQQYPKTYRVLAPDVPGLSAKVSLQGKKHSARNIAAWLDEFLAATRIEHCHIVSHGTACPLSAYFAATRPDKVASLTWMNFPDLLGGRAADQGAAAVWMQHALNIESASDFNVYMEKMFYRPPSIPGLFKRYSFELFKSQRDAVVTVARELLDSQPLLLVQLNKIKCPSLLIASDHDYLAPASFSTQLQAHMPALKTVLLQNCGHICFMEKLQEVEFHHKQFLAGLSSRA